MKEEKQPNRKARRRYVWAVTGLAFLLIAWIAHINPPGSLIHERVIDGLVSLLMLVSAAYLGASAADFFASRKIRRNTKEDDNASG